MDAGGTVVARQAKSEPIVRACAIGIFLCSGVLIAGIATLLLSRRIGGQFDTPLPPIGLAAAGVLLAVLAIGLRFSLPKTRLISAQTPSRWWFQAVLFSIPTLLAVLAASAIVLPGTAPLGIAALVSILLGEETAWLAWFVLRQRRSNIGRRSPRTPDARPKPSLRFDHPQAREPHILPDDLSQRIQRGRSDDDRDVCHGHVRSCFQQGQRTDTIHLAFCPPFLTTPELHLEQLDGPDADIKTTQLFPYGARLEIRLARASGKSVQTVIEFSAIAD